MKRAASIITAVLVVLVAGMALAEKIPNWAAPSTWKPPGAAATEKTGVKTGLVTYYPALPFIPVTPCRVADTRAGSGFPAGYGPPSMPGVHAQRSFILWGRCGIPSGASAVSFNFTVWAPVTRGDIRLFPAGDPVPNAATLNWEAGILALANAAVVPLSGAGAITVQVDGPGTIDLIIDVNGYYSGASASGQGMSLTASGSNNALTLNLTGNGDGLDINANTTGYSLWSLNSATTCSGICGGFFGVDSTTAGAMALGGYAYGTTTRNIGVNGISSGVGTAVGVSTMAAGVFGEASNTAVTSFSAGVVGLGRSTNAYSAGIFGEATGSEANGGFFRNAAGTTDIRTFASYNGLGAPIGLATNGQIIGLLGLQISGGTKNFVTPHPEDPSREIAYVAAEGPTSDVFFRGTARLENGVAVVVIPDHFRHVAREDSYMATVTVVGERAVLWVEAQGPDGIVVKGSGNARFNYVVWGERDEFRGHEAVRPNTHFTPEALEKSGAVKTYPESTRALLVRNGTLNPDGTYNRTTALRLGWNIPEPPPESVAAPIDTLEAKKK